MRNSTPKPSANKSADNGTQADTRGDSWEGAGLAAPDFDPAELDTVTPGAPARPDTRSPTDTGAGPAPDPFDPAALRLSQDFGASLGVKKALLTVPVCKPDKTWFVRVHPSEEYRLQTTVIEL